MKNKYILCLLCWVLAQSSGHSTLASTQIFNKVETPVAKEIYADAKIIGVHQKAVTDSKQWHLYAIAAIGFAGLSVVSMVLAAVIITQLSFFLIQLLALSGIWAILGFRYARRALREIKARPTYWKGRKLAKIALYISIGIGVVLAIFGGWLFYNIVSGD